jgi:hypothetical protein
MVRPPASIQEQSRNFFDHEENTLLIVKILYQWIVNHVRRPVYALYLIVDAKKQDILVTVLVCAISRRL